MQGREVAPDQIDDRAGVIFVANDYKMVPMMADIGEGDGENLYCGMEKMLWPQFRSLYRRIARHSWFP
jgi:protein-tyrosine phosphatase